MVEDKEMRKLSEGAGYGVNSPSSRRYILFRGNTILGVYPSLDIAIRIGYEKTTGTTPFSIKEIGPGTPTISISHEGDPSCL